jgi:Carboxypeptidase regulatory-like domain
MTPASSSRPRAFATALPLLVLVLVAAFAVPRMLAQNVYAALHGSVTDSSGAVVPGATVELTNTSTGIKSTTTTDGKGFYIFPQVAPGGPYSVNISVSGFSPYASTGLQLSVNDNREADAKLQAGTSTTVEVSAAATQVEVSDTQLKTTFTSQQIADLPLLGRDVVQLQKVSPGVVESSDRFGTFSTNGSQTSGNSFLLDGADINDGPLQSAGITPNPDALGEFQVTTSTMNPEYSRNSGAIVLEQLKTGTNQFHGDVFEFYRDSSLDARDYFSTSVPPLHQNIFGATLGGPVLKDKLFFFAAYQGLRNRTSNTTNTPVFSAAERGGDYTNDFVPKEAGGHGDLLTSKPIPFAIGGCPAGTPWNACFPNGTVTIPTTQFSALSTKLLNQYVPLPNNIQAANLQLYNFHAANTESQDQGILRFDFTPTSKDTLWASTIFQSSPNTEALPFSGATLPGFTQTDAGHVKIFNASYTHIFNSTTFNELRANYYRYNYHAVTPQQVMQPASYGFNINPQDAAGAAMPTINVTGYFSLGFSPYGPQPRNDQTMVFTDNLSKVIGAHNMRFGFQVHRYTVDNPYYSSNNGDFSFAQQGSINGSGDPALDFMLGIPATYNQTAGGIIDTRAWEYYGFAQDNWKVSNTFTLNYGVGYDVETPYEDLQFGGEGVICWTNSSYNSTIFPGLPGMKYPGDPGCNSNGGPTSKYDHFAPRFGFAWSPNSGPKALIGDGAQKLSIRGGFGVYFNRDQEEGSLQNLNDPPFGFQSQGYVGNPGFANPFAAVDGSGSIPNPFPFTFPTVGSNTNVSGYNDLILNQFDPKNTVPYVYNFNLNIERALSNNIVAQIGYVGSMGHHLVTTYEADPITAAGHAACLANAACVQNSAFQHYFFPGNAAQPATNAAGVPYYASIGTQATEGSSNYNSLQAQLRMVPTHHVSFTLSYTYSHALDNSSGLESAGFNGRGYNWVPGYQYLNYGDSDYDARHRFVALYQVQVPIGDTLNSHLLTRTLLAGWNLGGITTLQTGFPLNITDTGIYNSLWCDAQSYWYCPDNPNVSTFHVPTKVASPNSAGFNYFTPSLFSQEAIGSFGNVKRGFMHGPGFNYTNLDIFKDFYLSSEHVRYIELRVEAFNAFNHPNFAAPDTNYTDGAQFGQITSVVQPGVSNGNANGDPQPARSIQLAGKFYF